MLSPSTPEINKLIIYLKEKNFTILEKYALKFVKKFPNFAFGWKILGIALFQNDKISKSIASYKKSLDLNSSDFETNFNLALSLQAIGDLANATNYYKITIKLNSNYIQSYINLGVIFKSLGNLNEAIKYFEKVIILNPNLIEGFFNLGIILQEKNLYNESIKYFERVLSINPKLEQAYNSLGHSYQKINKIDESISAYKKAISINPNYAEAFNNLGIVYRDLGNLDESVNAYKKAISINPNYAEAFNNLSYTYLQQYKFDKSFKYLEWRWKAQKRIGNKFESIKPLWNGEKEKKIFIWKEQGIGDEIMFCSIIPEILNISKKIILCCDERLISIFKRSISNNIKYITNFDQISENEFDYHIPMGSLQRLFRNKIEDYKISAKGYLLDDKKRTSILEQNLKKNNNKLIGISWHTNSFISMKSFRNISLEKLTLSLNFPKINFINLQYGDFSKEIKLLNEYQNINIYDDLEIDKKNNLDDLVSLMAACDLVITIDNITAHLAGNLGISSMILLPYNADPRWGLKNENSYLYNSVKLYRQLNLGNWDDVLKKLRKDVYDLLL